MKTDVKKKAKATAKAELPAKPKQPKRVKLKKTTRGVLYHARLLQALTPRYRKIYAKWYRSARRNGRTNLQICDINQPKKKARKT